MITNQEAQLIIHQIIKINKQSTKVIKYNLKEKIIIEKLVQIRRTRSMKIIFMFTKMIQVTQNRKKNVTLCDLDIIWIFFKILFNLIIIRYY